MPSKNSTISRSWKCVFVNQQCVNPANAAFQICLTSRTDGAAVNYVHDTLYGSIRYSITQQVMLPELQETTLLMMRLQVLDAVKGTEIRGKKEKLNGEKIIDGVTETSMHLTQQDADDDSYGDSSDSSPATADSTKWSKCFSVTSKIKFLDVSSNYDGSPFRFQISYYDPRALEQPIMVVQSAPFKVYARRKRKRGTAGSAKNKSATTGISKKPKSLASMALKEDLHENDLYSDSMDCYGTNSMHPAEFDSENEFGAKKAVAPVETKPSTVSFKSTLAEPPAKRQKLSSDELFQLYVSEFDQLMDLTKKMSNEDRTKAVSTALQHLIGAPAPLVPQQQTMPAPQHNSTLQFFDKVPTQEPLSFTDPLLSSTTQQPQQSFQFPQPTAEAKPLMASPSLDVVHNPPSTSADAAMERVTSTHPLNFDDNLSAFGVSAYDNATQNDLFSFGF